ncbi:hypothetical protein ABE10_31635 [Bacillus toyonensis]|nr:hypothetical protein [Bacillus toyonensis]
MGPGPSSSVAGDVGGGETAGGGAEDGAADAEPEGDFLVAHDAVEGDDGAKGGQDTEKPEADFRPRNPAVWGAPAEGGAGGGGGHRFSFVSRRTI